MREGGRGKGRREGRRERRMMMMVWSVQNGGIYLGHHSTKLCQVMVQPVDRDDRPPVHPEKEERRRKRHRRGERRAWFNPVYRKVWNLGQQASL